MTCNPPERNIQRGATLQIYWNNISARRNIIILMYILYGFDLRFSFDLYLYIREVNANMYI